MSHRRHAARLAAVALAGLVAVSCGDPAESPAVDESGVLAPGGKADGAFADDITRANEFFVTQIRDERWNPDGVAEDALSNNCGPASLAMVLAERGVLPAELTAEQAIDHARALMYPGYPDIDLETLPDEAALHTDEGVLFVDDDSSKVYFDMAEDEPSVTRGIEHAGGLPAVGFSWEFLDDFLEADKPVIAYGHITERWVGRFPDAYGSVDDGAVPHFIAVFASAGGEAYIVCDALHHGGCVAMSKAQLGAFFQSPVNVYDTTIRLVAWDDAPERQ